VDIGGPQSKKKPEQLRPLLNALRVPHDRCPCLCVFNSAPVLVIDPRFGQGKNCHGHVLLGERGAFVTTLDARGSYLGRVRAKRKLSMHCFEACIVRHITSHASCP
jgi:hypothetical protein